MTRRLFIAIVSTLSCILLGYGNASAQTMTTFSKCVISFDSATSGTEVYYNGEMIGKTPFTAEVKADYLISCDKENSSEMSPSDIKGYNSIVIENYIKDSGKSSGAFPFFSMVFTFIDPEGKEGTVSVPLKWEEINLLGMKGSRVFYQEKVECSIQ